MQKLNSFKGKIRVLSDLHLGHPSSLVGNVSELNPLLEGIDVLVLNGDTIQDLNPHWNEKSKQMFSQQPIAVLEQRSLSVFRAD